MPVGIFGVSGGTSGVLPSQSGNSGKYLTTNGTDASWGTVAIKEIKTEGATWAAVFGSSSATYVNVTGATVTLTGLSASKTYDILVDANCCGFQASGAGNTCTAQLVIDGVGVGEQSCDLANVTPLSLSGIALGFSGATSITALVQIKSASGTANINPYSKTANLKITAVEQ